MNWQTFGHERVKAIFERQLEAATFSHAYLLYGPARIGKKMLAMEFVRKILKVVELANYPDFIFLDALENGSVESVRAFAARLGAKPFVGKKIIALIDNAEALSQESGNALLKTLEEPNESVVIILIASGAVLSTIVSRCQTFQCHQCTTAQLRAFAESESITADESVLPLAGGSIGTLKALTENQAKAIELQELVSMLSKASTGTGYEKLAVVQELAEREADILREALLCWVRTLVVSANSGIRIRAILEAAAQINFNVNKKHIIYQAVR